MKLVIPPKKAKELAEGGVFILTEITYDAMERLFNDMIAYIVSDEKHVILTLLINCNGGKVDGAIAFKEFTSTLKKDIRIHGIAFGECKSAANAILQFCHKRTGLKYCRFFIHHLTRDITLKLNGNEEEQLSQYIADSKKNREIMVRLQCERTGISEAEWQRLANTGHEYGTILSSEEALKLNLIDEIIESHEIF